MLIFASFFLLHVRITWIIIFLLQNNTYCVPILSVIINNNNLRGGGILWPYDLSYLLLKTCNSIWISTVIDWKKSHLSLHKMLAYYYLMSFCTWGFIYFIRLQPFALGDNDKVLQLKRSHICLIHIKITHLILSVYRFWQMKTKNSSWIFNFVYSNQTPAFTFLKQVRKWCYHCKHSSICPQGYVSVADTVS